MPKGMERELPERELLLVCDWNMEGSPADGKRVAGKRVAAAKPVERLGERLLNGVSQRFFAVLRPQFSRRTLLRLLRSLDRRQLSSVAARPFPHESWPTTVGRVQLDSPLILAAGLLKGNKYPTDTEALDAVRRGKNILAGWRSLPAMVGAAEMGSFTPSARMGHSGRVLWRDVPRQSLYNRMGLCNPGAKAAAKFLARNARDLPRVYGISIAADPNDREIEERCEKLASAVSEFVEAGLRPTWMTLNLSCPNTAGGRSGGDGACIETPEGARRAGEAVYSVLSDDVPLWAKVSPEMPEAAYEELAHALADARVEAVVATNTLQRTAPGSQVAAGLGGRALRDAALAAVAALSPACKQRGMALVGCGGVFNGSDLVKYLDNGASAVQYCSVLVHRGPLSPAFIIREARNQQIP